MPLSTKMQERGRKVSKQTRHQAEVTRPKARVKTQRKITHHVGIAAKKDIHHLNIGADQMQSAASAISLDIKLSSAAVNFRSRKQMLLRLLVKMTKIIFSWQNAFQARPPPQNVG